MRAVAQLAPIVAEHWKVPRRLPLSLIPALLALAGPVSAASAAVPFTATSFTASSPMGLAAGDVDGDHAVDLVTANGTGGAAGVFVNDGHGAFAPGLGSPIAVTGTPGNLAVGDLNGDGLADLVVPAYTDMSSHPLTTAAVLLSTGSGFTPAPSNPLPTGNGPSNAEIADFDADGKPDLAIVNADDETLSIYLGDGAGGFVPAPGGPISVTARYLAIGDFNGDGKRDIAAALTQHASVALLLGDGTGAFAAGQVIADANVNDIVATDLDSDGDLDLVTSGGGISSGNVVPLLNDGTATFTTGTPSPLTSSISLTAGDFNADGRPDVAAVQMFGGKVHVLLGDGHGAFGTPQPITVSASPFSILTTDVDGDGRDDLAATSFGGSKLWVLRNDALPSGALDPAGPRDLGSVEIGGTRGEATVTVRSSGTAALHARAVTVNGAGFSIAQDACSNKVVDANATCTITVAFAPVAAGAASGTLAIPTDDQTLSVALSATGVKADAATTTPPQPGAGELKTPATTTPAPATTTPTTTTTTTTKPAVPKACVSRRVVVLHPSRAFLGAKVAVTMNGRTIARIARATRTVRIDLTGRPEGTARVVLTTAKGAKQVRSFKTCA